ncbi:MAG: hypothetical protein ABIG68_07255 [Acidobacteriota bacterium]
MTRCAGFFGVAALALALAANSARAQELQLREADIPKLSLLLRVEAADLGAGQALFDRKEAARSSFSGDPLEWFRARAKVDLPEGAKYVASCSRAASAGGPVAIFTFGRTIDCYERTWRDYSRSLTRSPDEKLPLTPPMSQSCQVEHGQTSKFLETVQEALRKRGFVELGFFLTEMFSSPDRVFQVDLWPHNIYDRANRPDDHPLIRIESEQARETALAACSDMPSGPILELFPGDRFFEKEPLDTLDTALQKAGLTAKEYEALKEALFLARMDTQPEWFQAAEAVAGNDPAALRDLAIRRANADLYRKFAAELGPLLDALVPRM